ncbi:MAG: DHA2 family efflux MFS transporter permease subunit [Actinomycetaceae bacterium]|nr:DHA2 family efflux MFS transporter permease subunit [Actinomycetaceae bacterium]
MDEAQSQAAEENVARLDGEDETAPVTEQQRRWIFRNIIITTVASSALATSLGVAIPAIMRDLEIPVTTARWLSSGYILTMAIMMPLTAFMAKRIPTRRLYLGALSLFLAGLVANAVATSFPVMMTGRVIQAIGGGMVSSLAQMIILTIFPAGKRGSAMGWWGLASGAAPIIAPTLTGLVIDVASWRVIFYVAIGAILLSLVVAFFVFRDVLETSKPRFDVPSFILSVFTFGGIVLGFGNGGAYPVLSLQVLGAVLIGVFAGVLFVVRQLRLDEPLLNVGLLKTSRTLALSAVAVVLYHFVMLGSSLILPIYVQNVVGGSATASALMMMPGAAFMTFMSPVAGRWFDRLGATPLLAIGGLTLAASTFGMFFVTLQTPLWVPALLNIVRGGAQAALMMMLVTWGTSRITRSDTPDGTALLSSIRSLSTATGSAVLIGIMDLVQRTSIDSYGANAGIHGVNVTFALMALPGLGLVLIAAINKALEKNQHNRLFSNH